jgi:hypothetical protein
VRDGQRRGGLGHDAERLAGREWPLGQPLIQRLAADQFPDQVGHGQAVGQYCLPEVEHPRDPWVREVQRGPADQAERQPGRGVVGRVAGQQLHRHLVAGAPVHRPPHSARIAGRYRLDQPVPVGNDRSRP